MCDEPLPCCDSRRLASIRYMTVAQRRPAEKYGSIHLEVSYISARQYCHIVCIGSFAVAWGQEDRGCRMLERLLTPRDGPTLGL